MASQGTVRTVDRTERRRSPRFPYNVTLMVCGVSTEDRSFKEETFTLSIDANGALVALATQVTLGQTLLLMNPHTWDEKEARVSRLGELRGQHTQVAIEFAQPSPEFWPIGAPTQEIVAPPLTG